MSELPATQSSPAIRHSLLEQFGETRTASEQICQPLETEDHVVQPTAEVSPPKWHLGHTTWFFEEMLLARFMPGYQRRHSEYGVIFNSYYKGAGQHWIQAERGQLSRPTVKDVLAYRQHIDELVTHFLQQEQICKEALDIIELGLHHEQQHQELLLMDIKYILGVNPSLPCYANQPLPVSPAPTGNWHEIEEGLFEIGHAESAFAYDNEKPRHKTYLHPFAICDSLVTNGEYLAFMQDDGYDRPELWLSKGYDFIKQSDVTAPLYWLQRDGQWHEFTLHGLRPLEMNAPVCHLSYFEAAAYAAWRDARLPTEQEFETALTTGKIPDDETRLVLQPCNSNAGSQVWCWTASHYSPYPGFRTFAGPLQEYNGKFMCNQFVLRGGCVATPTGHLRHSYRNFYEPHQRWMFSGLRLARDIS